MRKIGWVFVGLGILIIFAVLIGGGWWYINKVAKPDVYQPGISKESKTVPDYVVPDESKMPANAKM